MDKMLVDSLGDIVITNDGATILDEIDVQHPAAKMIVEIAKTQDEEVGDGTTTAVVLAGELLTKAQELMGQDVHASVVVGAYRDASKKALDELEKVAKGVETGDRKTLQSIARTSMTGKAADQARDHLAKIAVAAAQQVAEDVGGKVEVDIDYINMVKKQGAGVLETDMVSGTIIDKEVVHPAMPKVVERAKIALVDAKLEVQETETDAEIKITSPDQLKDFLGEEERMLKEMVDKFKKVGANVVFCQKGIDDLAQHYMAKSGILAARRVKKSDMEKLSRATGARVVTNLSDLSKEDLGAAGIVEERKIAGDEMIFIENCRNPKAVTLFIRGGTEHVVDEVERALHDAVSVVAAVLENNKIVPGGGAVEAALSRALESHATTIGGKGGLAVQAFAEALRIVPKSLAENAGLDPIDIVQDLVAKNETVGPQMGIDIYKGKIADMYKLGVIEPLEVIAQILKSAVEATNMILRIDDVISAKELKSEGPPPGGPGGGPPWMGGPPGMGGMGGMGGMPGMM
jgi:thermosome